MMLERYGIGELRRIAMAAIRLRDEPHHVTFHELGWELEHNLVCRVAGMRHCSITRKLEDLEGPPVSFGRYQVTESEAGALAYVPATTDDAAAELLAELAAGES